MDDRTIWTGPKTSGFVIIPDALDQAIAEKLDATIAAHPELAGERESMRQALIGVFRDYGHIDCEFVPAAPEEAP